MATGDADAPPKGARGPVTVAHVLPARVDAVGPGYLRRPG